MNFNKLVKKVKEFINDDSKKKCKYCDKLKDSLDTLKDKKDEIKSLLREKPKKSVRNKLLEELTTLQKQREKAKKLLKKTK